MKTFSTVLGAALLCSAFALQAQTPAPQGEPGKGMREHGKMGEHRKEMRDKMKAAHEACKDKPDQKACMTEQMCAKAEDKAKCQAQAKERHGKHAQRMEQRQKMHEACTGKRGDELQKCLGEQHKQHRQSRKPEGKA